MTEATPATEDLPVKDNRAEDAKKIAQRNKELEMHLEKTGDAFNATLAILTGLYLQPFAPKEYLGSDEMDHVNYMLTALLMPIAKVMAHGHTDNAVFVHELTRLVSMCFNYFVTVRGIVTPQSQIEHDEVKYKIREDNLAPYVMQVDPELPRTEFHDQPLQVLLKAIQSEGEDSGLPTETQTDGAADTEQASEEEVNKQG
jgi:hypothetical protein